MPEGGGGSVERPIFITVAESLLTIQNNTLSVFNIIIKHTDSTVSLIRYPFDLLEFHQKICQYYPKVKITFPGLSNPSQKQVLQQQRRTQRQTQQQQQFSSASLSTTTTTAKSKKKRRSLRDLIILPFNKKRKTNADKVEKYLQQCFQHPVVSISSILRDFITVQREEDAILTSYYTSTTLTPTINNSSHQQQPSLYTNKLPNKESSIIMPSYSRISHSTTEPTQLHIDESNGIKREAHERTPTRPTHADIDQQRTTMTTTAGTAHNPQPSAMIDKQPSRMMTTTATSEEAPSFDLSDLDLIRVLGKGCMGKVFLVKAKKETDGRRQLYALKCIKKNWVIQQKEVAHTRAERDILLLLRKRQQKQFGDNGGFFAQINQLFQTSSCLFFLLDYYAGGDLATQLSIHSYFSPERARFYAAEMIQGLEILHKNNIIYRDLKPENVLIGRDGHIVLTDFGLSKLFNTTTTLAESTTRIHDSMEVAALDDLDRSYRYDDDEVLTTRTFCGTAEYLAPEVLVGEAYTFVVDFWSLGTLLYEMLAGTTPFWAEKHIDMYRRVLEEPVTFPSRFDRDTRNFLAGLLEKEPYERLGWGKHGIEDIKTDPYFKTIDWHMVEQRQLTPPFIPTIKSEEDVSNFDESFTSMPIRISQASSVDVCSADTDMKEKAKEGDPFEGFSFCSLLNPFDKQQVTAPPATNINRSLINETAISNDDSLTHSGTCHDNNFRKRHNDSSTIIPKTNFDSSTRALKKRQTDHNLNRLYTSSSTHKQQRQQLPCILKRASDSSSSYSLSFTSNSVAVVKGVGMKPTVSNSTESSTPGISHDADCDEANDMSTVAYIPSQPQPRHTISNHYTQNTGTATSIPPYYSYF